MAAIALVCFVAGRPVTAVLVTVVIGVCAFELYEAFRRAGYHTATLIGLLGCVAMVPIAYNEGERAYPLVSFVVVTFAMLWYLFEVVRQRPTVNIALDRAGLRVRRHARRVRRAAARAEQDRHRAARRRRDLRHRLRRRRASSPGAASGTPRSCRTCRPTRPSKASSPARVAALVLGGIVGATLHPWATKGIGAGLALGLVVAVTAPIGDLVESMIKRDLGVKDLGALLPGHGGFLDRFDAMLFCLPAAYYLAMLHPDPLMPTRVAVLGSTGSVGTQALEVIRHHRDHYDVVALAAGRNVELLAAQAAEFGVDPTRARSCARRPRRARRARRRPRRRRRAQRGRRVRRAARHHRRARGRQAARRSPTRRASIAAGPVVPGRPRRGGGEIVPVDSEHSALYQCLRAGTRRRGGPARGSPRAAARSGAGPAASSSTSRSRTRLKHPTWDMGAKITIDSSTLMNKGLEVIEAHELFGVDFDHIDVVVHPQSIVHGMVEFSDGATIAQLSMPDMRLPIGLALGAPDRLAEAFGAIDWATLGTLTFEAPDLEAFPAPRPRLPGRPGRRRRPRRR